MILDTLSSKVDKFCDNCFTDTAHENIFEIVQLPRVLCLIINKPFRGYIYDRIEVSNLLKIHVNCCEYRLLASVHHHGCSVLSGHYTANIYFSDSFYICNDHIISKMDIRDEVSDTAYVVFYTLSSW